MCFHSQRFDSSSTPKSQASDAEHELVASGQLGAALAEAAKRVQGEEGPSTGGGAIGAALAAGAGAALQDTRAGGKDSPIRLNPTLALLHQSGDVSPLRVGSPSDEPPRKRSMAARLLASTRSLFRRDSNTPQPENAGGGDDLLGAQGAAALQPEGGGGGACGGGQAGSSTSPPAAQPAEQATPPTFDTTCFAPSFNTGGSSGGEVPIGFPSLSGGLCTDVAGGGGWSERTMTRAQSDAILVSKDASRALHSPQTESEGAQLLSKSEGSMYRRRRRGAATPLDFDPMDMLALSMEAGLHTADGDKTNDDDDDADRVSDGAMPVDQVNN